MDDAKNRLVTIAYLEGALKFAEELGDGSLAYLIECALEASSLAASPRPWQSIRHSAVRQ